MGPPTLSPIADRYSYSPEERSGTTKRADRYRHETEPPENAEPIEKLTSVGPENDARIGEPFVEDTPIHLSHSTGTQGNDKRCETTQHRAKKQNDRTTVPSKHTW